MVLKCRVNRITNGYSEQGNENKDNQQCISVNTIRNRNNTTAKSHRHSKTRKRNLIHHTPSTPTPALTQHSHTTAHTATSHHNTPSTISILPPILRGLSTISISGGATITLYYDSFHLHFPFQPLCLHILTITTRRLEWTGRGKPPLRVGRPWTGRRYFIPIRIDGA